MWIMLMSGILKIEEFLFRDYGCIWSNILKRLTCRNGSFYFVGAMIRVLLMSNLPGDFMCQNRQRVDMCYVLKAQCLFFGKHCAIKCESLATCAEIWGSLHFFRFRLLTDYKVNMLYQNRVYPAK